MINNLRPNNLPKQLVSVYDYTEYNYNELLCKFFNTINLCVDECNRVTDFTNESHDYMLNYSEETRNILIEYSEETRNYVDTVNQLSKDFIQWCKDEGISIEAQKILNEMYEDGRLEELLNTHTLNKVKEDLENKINELENKCINSDLNLENSINSNFSYLDDSNYFISPNKIKEYNNDNELIDKIIELGKEKGKILFPRNGVYNVNKTFKIPYGIDIDFNNSQFNFTDGEYINDFAFLISTDDENNWLGRNRMDFVKIHKIEAINKCVNTELKLFLIGCGADLIGVSSYNFYQSICWTNNYIDYAHVEELHVGRHQGELFACMKPSNGDQVYFKNCHISNSDNNNFIKVHASYGCVIEGTINGNIHLYRCLASTIKNGHHETGKITIEDSSCTIESNMFWKRNEENILIIDTNGSSNHYKGRGVNINNNTFILKYEFFNYDKNVDDVKINNTVGRIHFDNNRREVEVLGGDYRFAYSSSISVFKTVANTSILIDSTDMDIINENRIYNRFYNLPQDGNSSGYSILNSVSNTVENINFKDDLHGKTLYYVVGLVFDDNRKMGLINKDVYKSCSVDKSKGNRIFLNKDFIGVECFYRIYRGESPNNYTHYVDIPCICSGSVVDNGYSVNGFVWKERTTTSIDEFNKCFGYHVIGNKKEFLGVNIPSVGTWNKADRIINYYPSENGSSHFVCVESGTSGTWQKVFLTTG